MILFVSSPAGAESTRLPTCPISFAPTPLGRIPANLPALVVRPGEATSLRASNRTTADDRTFEVVEDPGSPETKLIVPSRPFEAGVRYEIALAYDCVRDGNAAPEALAFDSLRDVPLPTQVGELAPGPARYASSEVRLTPGSGIAAFLPATRFELRVGGAPWVVVPYGEAKADDDGTVSFQIPNLGGASFSSSICSAGEVGIKRFDVELRAHVAGATSDPAPATTVGVPIDCTRPAFAADSPAGESADGCSISSARRAGEGVLSMLAVVAGLFGLRRRSRRASA